MDTFIMLRLCNREGAEEREELLNASLIRRIVRMKDMGELFADKRNMHHGLVMIFMEGEDILYTRTTLENIQGVMLAHMKRGA